MQHNYKVSCTLKVELSGISVKATSPDEATKKILRQDIDTLLAFGYIETSDVESMKCEEED